MTSGERKLAAVRCVAATDRGLRRTDNQDSYGIVERENFRFYMVADGMGGARAGGVASDIAVTEITACLLKHDRLSLDILREAVQRANSVIRQIASERIEYKGMGTTICGLGFTDDQVYVCNVGDSRLYRLRSGHLSCITQDHTLAAELVKTGAITRQQSESSPVAHILTRALGVEEFVEVDVAAFERYPLPGDRFVLCSDGLHGMLSDDEIQEALGTHSIKNVADSLVVAANGAGGVDNITVLVLELTNSAAQSFDIEDSGSVAAAEFCSVSDTDKAVSYQISWKAAVLGGSLGLLFALGMVALFSPLEDDVLGLATVLSGSVVSEFGDVRARLDSEKSMSKPARLKSLFEIKSMLRAGGNLWEIKGRLAELGLDPARSRFALRAQIDAEVARLLQEQVSSLDLPGEKQF